MKKEETNTTQGGKPTSGKSEKIVIDKKGKGAPARGKVIAD